MRTFDLSPLYRSTVGFDRLFSMLDQAAGVEPTSYPPYNIARTAENAYRITVAVAGFADNDLTIEARENTLTIRGSKVAAEGEPKNETLYQGIAARAFNYTPLGDSVVLGLRGDFQYATEGTPFFGLPYVQLRGIPALRYQDRQTAVVETELRWNFTARWSAVGFVGAGRAFGRSADFADADTVVSRGLGIRYLLARRLGLYGGFDVAHGPEEDVFYIQVGSAWR